MKATHTFTFVAPITKDIGENLLTEIMNLLDDHPDVESWQYDVSH